MMNYRDAKAFSSWWCQQMEPFSALVAICAGNSPVPGEFPAQRPVTRGFDVLFDLHLNKRLSKQWWGWWFETPSRTLLRHCKVYAQILRELGSFEDTDSIFPLLVMPQSHPTTDPVRFLSLVRFLARKAEWSARRNFTSVLFSWSH